MTLRNALVVVLLLLVVMAAQAYLSFQAQTQENFAGLRKSVGALDFHLAAALGGIDELLSDCAERIDPDHWPDPALLPWLTGRLAATPAADTILVVGADGRSIGPGVGARENFPVPLNSSDREYFRHFIEVPGDHALHIGEPFVSRLDHRYVLPASRAIYSKTGQLRAVVRIALDPARLIGDFASLMSGDAVSNIVFHDTGALLVSAAPKDPGFAGLEGVRDLVRSAGSDGATKIVESGRLRLVTYHRIPKYNLIVLSGIGEREAYATLRREQLPVIGMLAMLSLAIIGFAILFDRRARQHEAAIADHQSGLERLVAERTAALAAENQIRAKTEEALRASRRRLVSITDSLLHGILVFNAAGEMVFANLAARRILGADAEEMEGLSADDFLQLVEEGRPVPFALSPLARVAELVNDNDAVLRIVRRDIDIPIAYVCAPLADESRRRNFVLSFRDITDIKRTQWELLQTSRLASVGQLASGIAHEINTPIQYIGNNLSFIADAVGQLFSALSGTADEKPGSQIAFLAEELPVAISESQEGVAHIARIVLSMKEFSHPGNTAKTLVDLNHALDTTLTVSSNVWKHAAAIERDYDPDLPQVPCLAGEMNQVFLNLIVNAVHAIEGSGKPLPGTISIATRRKDDHAEIRIEDSGTGIPSALRDKIFDPFFTTKEVGKGTGQGLAICQDVVVVKHGGAIEVGGSEGMGAVFTIRLPLEETGGQVT